MWRGTAALPCLALSFRADAVCIVMCQRAGVVSTVRELRLHGSPARLELEGTRSSVHTSQRPN